MSSAQDPASIQSPLLTPAELELRKLKAMNLARVYALGALAVGLIPLPLIDIVLAVAIEVRMLQKLALHYGYSFDGRQRVYALWGALLGGALLPMLMLPLVLSLVKFIPVIGTAAGMITLPAVLFGSAYAIGRVFIQHFEAGGTLLSFDPTKVQALLRSYYEEGRRTIGFGHSVTATAGGGGSAGAVGATAASTASAAPAQSSIPSGSSSVSTGAAVEAGAGQKGQGSVEDAPAFGGRVMSAG